MKTVKHAFVLLAVFFIFQSCDSVEELSKVNIDTSLSKEVTFTSDANGDFSGSMTIDLSENDDVADYLDKIEAVKINGATYQIKAFSGSEGTSGNIDANVSGQSFQFVHSDFFDDFQNQTVYNFEGADKLNAIAVTIKNTKQLQVTFSGNSSASEAFDMTVKMMFDVTITAQAL